MVVRMLVRVTVFVHMRMWVVMFILAVMRVRMDMVMLRLCIPVIHAHHRLSDFSILQVSALHRKPPRGMKFERDFHSV